MIHILIGVHDPPLDSDEPDDKPKNRSEDADEEDINRQTKKKKR